MRKITLLMILLILSSFLFVISCSKEDSSETKVDKEDSIDDDIAEIEDDIAEDESAAENNIVETKSPTNAKDSSAEIEFIDANYKGPFPAPEGIVLVGLYGKDIYKSPTGNGMYRFNLQTAWQKHISCLDDTRTIMGSKGKNWEIGFANGYNVGRNDREAIPQLAYNDYPQGVDAGNKLYDEGYKLGYERGYDLSSYWGAQYSCPGHDVDLSDYDSDGWMKLSEIEDMPGIKTIYIPPTPYSGMGYSSQTALGSDSKSFLFDTIDKERMVEKTKLNNGKQALNIDRIDFLDTEQDATEQKMTELQIAEEIYKMSANQIVKYGPLCKLSDPKYETKTYGKNTFVQLTFMQMCTAGSASGEPNWNIHAYAFMKSSDNKRILTFFFHVPFSLKKKGVDELDSTKAPGVDFISQFLEKVDYQ
ncbi:hypothetical protein HZA96_02595 [Candidatus Woesearchaeota archaeon]|nr:hypothetical protein [Candidatus Woesearchaeota archaeon]